ncbi:hypothetical protein Pyn_17918 [Prunus yedoensis var. nudiflora]|uniref:Beta-glucosidase 12-like n=1 Tax=Prunus yedoensis var. nudiflora TaxID=2094558 RepID=A0A314YHC4_PRUYE|nr:hypothetical protein Pyn_17918 [Prunus yedoensis var. nudiflora]
MLVLIFMRLQIGYMFIQEELKIFYSTQKRKYNDPLIYITENGIDEFSHPKLSREEALNDSQRIDYYYNHLYYVQRAIKHGVHVKGFFAWSLLDNFEWYSGYTLRFGMNFVDYKMG